MLFELCALCYVLYDYYITYFYFHTFIMLFPVIRNLIYFDYNIISISDTIINIFICLLSFIYFLVKNVHLIISKTT